MVSKRRSEVTTPVETVKKEANTDEKPATTTSSDNKESSARATFALNEAVVAHDNGLRGTGNHMLAKIKEVRYNEEDVEWEYLVHWDGWSARFDEWMSAADDRLMKRTDETEARVKLDKENKKRKNKPAHAKVSLASALDISRTSSPGADSSSQASGPTNSTTTDVTTHGDDGGSSKKRARKSTADNKGCVQSSPNVCICRLSSKSTTVVLPSYTVSAVDHARRKEVHITMPPALKLVLVDDAELVNGQSCDELMLVKTGLTCVKEIMGDYLECAKKEGVEHDLIAENCKGLPSVNKHAYHPHAALVKFFDSALGKHLLYKFERPQYADIIADFKKEPGHDDEEFAPSTTYGFVHLVRLFVRLGSYIAYTPWTPADVSTVLRCVDDFLKFLDVRFHGSENVAKYHSKDNYFRSLPDYQKRVFEA